MSDCRSMAFGCPELWLALLQMWKAPAALLADHESMHPPPVPPGGWVAAVRAAVAPLEAVMTAADILDPSDQPATAREAGGPACVCTSTSAVAGDCPVLARLSSHSSYAGCAVPVEAPEQPSGAEEEQIDMEVVMTGEPQLQAGEEPQQTGTGSIEMPESTHKDVKVKEVLCGGALKVMTPGTP